MLLNNARVRMGFLAGRNIQGKGLELWPNGEENRGFFNKGKLQHRIPDLKI